MMENQAETSIPASSPLPNWANHAVEEKETIDLCGEITYSLPILRLAGKCAFMTLAQLVACKAFLRGLHDGLSHGGQRR